MMKQKLFAAVCAFALCAALGTAIHAGQEAETAAPVAENLELTTFRNTSVGGTLSASAPDGSPLTFRITTEPIKGTVTLTDDGTFVYTPADGKRGRDYFGFRAADSSGRESQEATVIIAIKKQKPDVTYSDMAGRAEAAVMLGSFLEPSPAALTRSDVPDWACAAVASLTSCGVFPDGADTAAPITRAEAAQMLLGAYELLQKR